MNNVSKYNLLIQGYISHISICNINVSLILAEHTPYARNCRPFQSYTFIQMNKVIIKLDFAHLYLFEQQF